MLFRIYWASGGLEDRGDLLISEALTALEDSENGPNCTVGTVSKFKKFITRQI